ncbi:MAG: acyl carrier protein [Eubacteriales bacterium]|nr:acyl carrier protein [Eubacteriales bacterium]
MQLSRTQIIEKLKEILISADERNGALAARAEESASLRGDFGFSSVNMLYLVIAIEESFGIEFDDVSMSDFETLGDVVDYIAGKLG